MMNELLPIFWSIVREYIPAKDRQVAADHIINELVDAGISDEDLMSLTVDRIMSNAIGEHVDIPEDDEESEDE
jgi:hypothetical protein